jgi:hypothetical protein
MAASPFLQDPDVRAALDAITVEWSPAWSCTFCGSCRAVVSATGTRCGLCGQQRHAATVTVTPAVIVLPEVAA